MRANSGISVRNSPIPSAPVAAQLRHVEQQPGIEQQLDLDPVAGHRRHVAQRLVIGAPPGARRHRRGDALLDIGARADQHRAVLAVDDDDVAGVDMARRLGDPADDGNVEGARDDRDMRVGEPSSSTSPRMRRCA